MRVSGGTPPHQCRTPVIVNHLLSLASFSNTINNGCHHITTHIQVNNSCQKDDAGSHLEYLNRKTAPLRHVPKIPCTFTLALVRDMMYEVHKMEGGYTTRHAWSLCPFVVNFLTHERLELRRRLYERTRSSVLLSLAIYSQDQSSAK